MRITDLYEKRRNPNLNKKISVLDGLKKYAGQKDVFVSFTTSFGGTEITDRRDDTFTINTAAKIGINPKSPYSTPIGIYSYPIDYVLRNKGDVPFAGEEPNIWVMRLKPELKYIDEMYNTDDLHQDIKKLRDYYDGIIEPLNEIIAHATKNALKRIYAAGLLWNITRKIAIYLKTKTYDQDTNDEDQSSPVIWNRIFRTVLGYSGAINYHNEGIIHENERTQAVFFLRDAFTVIDLIKNIKPGKEKTQLQIYRENKKVFMRDLIRHKIPDDQWPDLVDKNIMDQQTMMDKEKYILSLPEYVKEYMKNHLYSFKMCADYIIEALHPTDQQIISALRKHSSHWAGIELLKGLIRHNLLTKNIREYAKNNYTIYKEVLKNPNVGITVSEWINIFRDQGYDRHHFYRLNDKQIYALLSLKLDPSIEFEYKSGRIDLSDDTYRMYISSIRDDYIKLCNVFHTTTKTFKFLSLLTDDMKVEIITVPAIYTKFNNNEKRELLKILPSELISHINTILLSKNLEPLT